MHAQSVSIKQPERESHWYENLLEDFYYFLLKHVRFGSISRMSIFTQMFQFFCFQMSLFKNGVWDSVISLFSVTNMAHWHMMTLKKRRQWVSILPFEILKSNFHQLIHSSSVCWKYQVLFYGLRHAGVTTCVPTWWKGNYFRLLT